MSRIRIVGLPKYATEAKLKDTFGPCGEITDCAILKNETNNRIRMAFIGFKKSDSAQLAVNEFNGSYFDTAKLTVEVAMDINGQKSTVHSKYTKRKGEKTQKVDTSALGEEYAESSGRVYVTNLPYSASPEELEERFKEYGSIAEVFVPKTIDTKQAKGVALVLFYSGKDAVTALQAHHTVFQGRNINVSGAKPAEDRSLDWSMHAGYKSGKLQKDKDNAPTDRKKWNPLYVNSNTAVSYLSEQMKVDKDELIGLDTEAAAVNQAHAITFLQKQIREYFSSEGYDLDVLGKNHTQYSKTVLLVTNLPKTSKEERVAALNELKKLFASCGSVLKISSPLSTAVVIVEFESSFDAQRAFKKLAYHKFRES